MFENDEREEESEVEQRFVLSPLVVIDKGKIPAEASLTREPNKDSEQYPNTFTAPETVSSDARSRLPSDGPTTLQTHDRVPVVGLNGVRNRLA